VASTITEFLYLYASAVKIYYQDYILLWLNISGNEVLKSSSFEPLLNSLMNGIANITCLHDVLLLISTVLKLKLS